MQDNLKNVMTQVDAMKSTNKELRRQYGKIDIDKIERLQDDMADLMDVGNDIQESLARSYDIPDEVDESELDAELEALGMEQELDMEMGGQVPGFLQDEVVPSSSTSRRRRRTRSSRLRGDGDRFICKVHTCAERARNWGCISVLDRIGTLGVGRMWNLITCHNMHLHGACYKDAIPSHEPSSSNVQRFPSHASFIAASLEGLPTALRLVNPPWRQPYSLQTQSTQTMHAFYHN